MLRVLALPGAGVVPADTPVLRGDDLGALRGDGVFETLHVRQGEPWLLDEHLARMRRSAERLALPLPAEDELAALARQAAAAWPAADDGALRLVCTRGPEDGGPPTVYATVAARRREDAVVRGEHGEPAVGHRAGRRGRAVGVRRRVRPRSAHLVARLA